MKNQLLLALSLLALALPASARYQATPAQERVDRDKIRQQLVLLRNAVSQRLYAMEALRERLSEGYCDGCDGTWYDNDYSQILQDAHRLYMDCEVEAAKHGAKPLHKDIVKLRHGHLYAWQHRDSAENDGFKSDQD